MPVCRVVASKSDVLEARTILESIQTKLDESMNDYPTRTNISIDELDARMFLWDTLQKIGLYIKSVNGHLDCIANETASMEVR